MAKVKLQYPGTIKVKVQFSDEYKTITSVLTQEIEVDDETAQRIPGMSNEDLKAFLLEANKHIDDNTDESLLDKGLEYAHIREYIKIEVL